MSEIIDTHVHLWDLARFRYGWLTPALPQLYRNFLPDDLAPILAANGVDRAIFVQAHNDPEETRWALGLSRRHRWLAGVVGWADLSSPDIEDALDQFTPDPKFVGVRLATAPAAAGVTADMFRGLRALSERRLVCDLLGDAESLTAVPEIAGELPELKLVINHLGQPPMKAPAGEAAAWRGAIRAAAESPNVYCKLSGIVTQLDASRPAAEQARAFVDELIDLFTPNRLMFGSDWPVCLLAGKYEEVVSLLREMTAGLTGGECDRVWQRTAAEVYLGR